ncbi:TonB-dependent receptor plug domain-containing protein [Muricauda sp. JGD-17]|uniref:TonB-dependent receptor plug domain-containing protein n=1 Tax=Flagellimonas ochracea TaxID=2696472 RepID=A0A964WY04_9FLAO|nr:carboxypeptidase-like regulatory domain-containing protein [Allomuricauda ochracea]NAY92392.1 TonB-dependent receptor plug domain-containing protein [Allomuricauda ochracea]
MSKRLLVLVLLLFSFCIASINAQSERDEPLTTILEELQERFGVQFNYVSKLVDDITLFAPETTLSLQETLDYLKSQTNLSFVFVSDNIISLKEERILLCGNLIDMDTGEVLPYVAIQNSSTGTFANEQGYFELNGVKRSDIIQIRHMGYKPVSLNVADLETSRCNTILLTPYHEKLAEITVYDFLVRGLDKLDNGSYQLDFDRFRTLPGLVEDDVLLSLQALPGIQSIDETVSNINIRGGSHDQNLITWDGIKMYQSGHFFGLISMYNPQITQKVELRKNGSSVSETDGVSGTIAMKTDQFLNSELKGSIGVNLIDANGFIDAPIGKKASFQIASRKSLSNLVETPTYDKYFERISQDTELENNSASVTNTDIAFDFYDTSFRLLFNPSERDQLRINFIHTANEVTFDEVAEVSGTQVFRQSNLDQTSLAEGLYYYRDWTEKLTTQIEIYNTDYKLKSINSNIAADQRFLQKNEVSETGIKVKVLKSSSDYLNWTGGYHFVETKVTNLDDVDDPVFIRLEGEVLRTHALFTEMGLSSKNAATQLNLGLRFNHLDEFDKQLWEPRMSFNQRLGQYFSLEFLGEFKHQSTSQVINFQNDFLGIEKRRWQLSNNQSIPVIESKQASLGLSFNKKGWLLNAVSFYKNVNGVTTQSQGFQDRYEFVKTSGSYESNGLDLLLRKQFRNNSIWLSYSYLNSDYVFDELTERRFPNNFDITHAVNLATNYAIDQLLLAVGLNWRTGKPLTLPESDNQVLDDQINYGQTNGNRLDDYFRVDISGKYEFNLSHGNSLEVGVAVWNVLNRENTINTFYRPTLFGDAQKFDQSSLGVTPNASLRLIFN